jgi:two-component system KDP operon response regulator KdpE
LSLTACRAILGESHASRAVDLGEVAAIHIGGFMNWKSTTIANRENGKRGPEGELPIRIASLGAPSGSRTFKSPERGGASAHVGMTVNKGALKQSRPATGEVDINRAEGENASSFLVAIQTGRDSGILRGRSLDAVSRDFSVNLLPLHELVARVCVALKRNHASNEEKVLFCVGDLHLDASRYLVRKRGRPLHLTPKEFTLLHKLMMHAGKPVPHRKLLRSVWGPECGYEREYLRTFVRQLRLKIEDNPADPKYLLTEPNIGYRFTESLEGDSAISSSNPVVAEA